MVENRDLFIALAYAKMLHFRRDSVRASQIGVPSTAQNILTPLCLCHKPDLIRINNFGYPRSEFTRNEPFAGVPSSKNISLNICPRVQKEIALLSPVLWLSSGISNLILAVL
jgi:hypothetical protein